jgi:hypothetical protein
MPGTSNAWFIAYLYRLKIIKWEKREGAYKLKEKKMFFFLFSLIHPPPSTLLSLSLSRSLHVLNMSEKISRLCIRYKGKNKKEKKTENKKERKKSVCFISYADFMNEPVRWGVICFFLFVVKEKKRKADFWSIDLRQ